MSFLRLFTPVCPPVAAQEPSEPAQPPSAPPPAPDDSESPPGAPAAEPTECHICFSYVDPATVVVTSKNGTVISAICIDCHARGVAWAAKSSLGFIFLRAEPPPKVSEELPLGGNGCGPF